MGRTKRSRRVGTYPEWNSFVPEEGEHPETVFLSIEEFETIRLIDYEHLTQQACADNMQVARTTVTDMYDHARFILADCLISGKKLVIAGGHYKLKETALRGNDFVKQKGLDIMRVAVPYEEGSVFQHFGRTETFKVYDIDHGATGKGNDQVRFELSVKALAPQLAIIAPWREWELRSRDQEIDYAAAHNIPIPVSHDHDYSMDRNMWHLSHEGSDLEDPWNAPKDELFIVTNIPEKAPDKPEYVELEYVEGVPVSVNGEKLSPAKLVEKLNEIGIRNAVGITDMVEDRLVGMKSRGVYENPAGAIIYYGHNDLENLCLDRATQSFKQQVSIRYSELVYDGMWFSPLREALDAFVNETQKTVTGTVRMKLYKGNIYSAGVKSPYSLYSQEYVTFGEDEVYNQADATGFINLFGLPLKVRALMKKGNLK